MKPLPAPEAVRHILSFDFDGTLHDPAADPSVPRQLFERLRGIRDSHAAVWGINTGRNIEYLLEGLQDAGFPFLPDWIVAREREIHRCTPDGEWRADTQWNSRCAREIDTLFGRHREVLDKIRHDVLHHTGAQWFSMEGEPAGVVAQSEEEIEWIVGRVLEHAAGVPDLSWERNSIYLRFSHRRFHKGSCLSELARSLSLEASHCFAIGDSHNDCGMLDGLHAGMVACPANAIAEIRELVVGSGGLVCTRSHGDAAVEALDHYFGTSR